MTPLDLGSTATTPPGGGAIVGTTATADLYARQRSIPIKTNKCVALVGVGGVGSWIGLTLALSGVSHLILFDGDVVSESNLNRTPYGKDMLGKHKTEALAALIKHLRPDCKVECYPNFSINFVKALGLPARLESESTINEFPSWLIASTDSWKSRLEAAKWTKTFAVKYMEAAAEGEVGSIAASPADFATAEEDNPGYASVPVWVGPAMSAAVMVCGYCLHGTNLKTGYSARLGWDAKLGTFQFTERKE